MSFHRSTRASAPRRTTKAAKGIEPSLPSTTSIDVPGHTPATSLTERRSTNAASRSRLENAVLRNRMRRQIERAVRAGRAPAASTSPVAAARRSSGRRGLAGAIAAFAVVAGLVVTMSLPAVTGSVAAASVDGTVDASAVLPEATQELDDVGTKPTDLPDAKIEATAPVITYGATGYSSTVPCAISKDGTVRYPLAQGCTIGSPFGSRFDTSTGMEAFHAGVDLDPGCGVDVLSMADGVITAIGWFGGYGYRIEISHPDLSVTTLYGHMVDGSAMVKVGEQVKVGQPIGSVGSTGKSTGCHLHFEVHVNGAAVDPIPWLAAHMK